MKTNLYKALAKFTLKLHNLSYKLSARFAVKAENGLHPKYRLMNYHQFFVDNVNEGDNVLDIGCGNGALTFDLAKKPKKLLGLI